MKILSSFTHPRVAPNLFEFLCSAELKGRYLEECQEPNRYRPPLTTIVFIFHIIFPAMEVNGGEICLVPLTYH